MASGRRMRTVTLSAAPLQRSEFFSLRANCRSCTWLHGVWYNRRRLESLPARDSMLSYLQSCWRYRYIVAAATLASGAVGWASAALPATRYAAVATVNVRVPRVPAFDERALTIPEAIALIRDERIVHQVIAAVPSSPRPATFIAKDLEVTPVAGTPQLNVRVSWTNPGEAARIANQLVEAAASAYRERQRTAATGERERLEALLAAEAVRLDRMRSAASAGDRQRLQYEAVQRVYASLAERIELLDAQVRFAVPWDLLAAASPPAAPIPAARRQAIVFASAAGLAGAILLVLLIVYVHAVRPEPVERVHG